VEEERVTFVEATCSLGFAPEADTWFVPARDAASGTTHLVQLAPDPARCQPQREVSTIWRGWRVDATGATGALVLDLDTAAVTAHINHAARLLARTSVGAAQALLDAAVGHAKVREQFGRPIGSFQALQHRLADVFIELEHTKSLVAAAQQAAPGDEGPVLTAMAKIASDRLAMTAAQTALQVHGGLGFTWELSVHHYLKEALRRRTLPQPTAGYQQQLRALVALRGEEAAR
jgi:alkylation response protein AidB-like acyl-CoA dehydrogenase